MFSHDCHTLTLFISSTTQLKSLRLMSVLTHYELIIIIAVLV